MDREKASMLEELKNKTFANEAEEAAWWESHEDGLLEDFKKATAEGQMGYGSLVITGDSTVAKVCIDPVDIAQARMQAAERGLRYQTYLKMIIHEALRKAAKPGAAKA
jgi:predicted DNA binding CopG/RHH family protein